MHKQLLMWSLAGVLAVGCGDCGDGGSSDASTDGAADVTPGDGGEDATPDARSDTSDDASDATTDVVADATADVTGDATTDAAADAATDADPGESRRAFVDACGYGGDPRDFRDAQVIVVDRLSDTGEDGAPGELRHAIRSVRGKRIVVFSVGGTIELNRTLDINADQSDLFVAGQSAPGGGITLKGPLVEVDLIRVKGADNIILRYLSLRGVKGTPGRGDLLSVLGATNFVVDHISASWSNDECFGFNNLDADDPVTMGIQNRVSVTNNLIAEPLAPHSTAAIFASRPNYVEAEARAYIGGGPTAPPFNLANPHEGARTPWRGMHLHERVSIHRNVFAHASHRMPLVGSHDTHVTNNVSYGWELFSYGTQGQSENDYVGNVLIENGPASRSARFDTFTQQRMAFPPDTESACRYDIDCERTFFSLPPSLFVRGNYIDHFAPEDEDGIPGNQWDTSLWVERVGGRNTYYACDGSDWRCLQNAERGEGLHQADGITDGSDASTQPCAIDEAGPALVEDVLATVGNSQALTCDGSWEPRRDAIDTRQIRLIREKGNSVPPRTQPGTNANTSPAHPDDVGGYATIARGTACADTDGDGLPDEFEIRHGLLVMGDDALLDRDGDGYTNIEEYLSATTP